jgi:hypothetical protein
MQIPEPMSLLESEDNYVLAGVGIQNSDGKWDETLKGELVYQYDKTGQPIYGNVYKIDDITGLYELDSNGDKIKLLDDNGDPIIDKLPLESESGQPLYGTIAFSHPSKKLPIFKHLILDFSAFSTKTNAFCALSSS